MRLFLCLWVEGGGEEEKEEASHMGAVEISAGGGAKIFREGECKKDPGRGTVFKT